MNAIFAVLIKWPFTQGTFCTIMTDMVYSKTSQWFGVKIYLWILTFNQGNSYECVKSIPKDKEIIPHLIQNANKILKSQEHIIDCPSCNEQQWKTNTIFNETSMVTH